MKPNNNPAIAVSNASAVFRSVPRYTAIDGANIQISIFTIVVRFPIIMSLSKVYHPSRLFVDHHIKKNSSCSVFFFAV